MEVFETLENADATGDSVGTDNLEGTPPSSSPVDSSDSSNSAKPANTSGIEATVLSEPDGGTADEAPQEPASATAPSDPVAQSIT
ncbi:MAG: hypothetical protein UDM07_03295, partial [Adlercreutzia sp.]|nr:hypothetical protein [Adlercreutzia sp.]